MSCHLTISTFNYVVKDPDCIRVSGQFWIKDSGGQSHNHVSSNLMRCLCLGSSDRLLSSLLSPFGLAAVFCATHLEYRTSLALSTPSRFSAFRLRINPHPNPSGRVCRTAAVGDERGCSIQTARRPINQTSRQSGSRSTQLLKLCVAVAWVCAVGVTPQTADQTLGLRSALPGCSRRGTLRTFRE